MRPLLLVLALVVFSVTVVVPQALLRRVTGPPSQHASAPPLAKVTGGTPLPGGSYTVGTGGYFPTLDSAFDRLSGGSILGPVTLLLTDTLYVASPSRGRMFQLTGPIAGTSKTNRLTIRPADGVAARIEGSGESTLRVLDVSYLTVDGIGVEGPTRLTIRASYNPLGTRWNNALDAIGNCDFLVVQNLTLYGGGNSCSIELCAKGGSGCPDSSLIVDNCLPSSVWGIYVTGYDYDGGFPSLQPKGVVIRRNRIGSPADTLGAWGMQLEGLVDGVIEQNEVAHLKNYYVSGNALTIGINAHGCTNTSIRGNAIHDLCGRGDARVWGILTSGSAFLGSGVQIVNNMIYDLRSIGNGSSVWIGGIVLMWANADVLVAYNTVFLDGSSALPGGTTTFYANRNEIKRMTIKNNILVNMDHQTTSSPEGFSLAMYFYGGISTITASDHNDLFVDPYPTSALVQEDALTFYSMANWQSTGFDAYSVCVLPVFRAPHLHLDSTAAESSLLAHAAIPLSSVPFDCDGNPRGSTPDIGAHQFTSPTTAVVAEPPGTMPTAFRLEQNYPNPFNPATVIRFTVAAPSPEGARGLYGVSLRVYDLLGREVAVLVNEEKPTGSYTVRFDGSRLPSGVYLCRMSALPLAGRDLVPANGRDGTAGRFSQTRKMMLLK